MPASKEPSGLLRDNDRRPDGISLIPWSQEKVICWNVAVVDNLAASDINMTTASQRGADEFAVCCIADKYSKVRTTLIFQYISINCLGAFRQSAVDFLSVVGSRLAIQIQGELLFLCIAIAIQRFNVVSPSVFAFDDFVVRHIITFFSHYSH